MCSTVTFIASESVSPLVDLHPWGKFKPFVYHGLQCFLCPGQVGNQLAQSTVLIPHQLRFLRLAHIDGFVLRLRDQVVWALTPTSRATSSARRPGFHLFHRWIMCALLCLLIYIFRSSSHLQTPFCQCVVKFVPIVGEQVTAHLPCNP